MPTINDLPISSGGAASRAGTPGGTPAGALAHLLRSWPEWSPAAAALWSATYALLGLWWMAGRGRFPFGVGPASGPAASLWAGARAETGAPLVAALALTGVMVALRLGRARRRAVSRSALIGRITYAWLMAGALLVLVPDARAIVAAAYAPIFLVGAPFGWPPVSYWIAVPWPVANQYLCIAGGFLWGATALASTRLARGACVACGRRDADAGWTSPAAARRWGGWATLVAVLAPLPYAATRLAWVAGIPLGISESLLREVRSTGTIGAALGLGSVAVAGAVLTSGLARPWGEVFPRWLPILRGRRVPPALAVAPASLVSVLVFAAGLGVTRSALQEGALSADWAAHLPGLLWPVWGLALGAATLAYYYRRRGRCWRCGRQ
jgi:hypothetical protein